MRRVLLPNNRNWLTEMHRLLSQLDQGEGVVLVVPMESDREHAKRTLTRLRPDLYALVETRQERSAAGERGPR